MVRKLVMDNPVENYFNNKDNINKKLSVKTLSKTLNMRKKDVYFYIFNCDNFVRVNPIDVGWNAHILQSTIFKYVK